MRTAAFLIALGIAAGQTVTVGPNVQVSTDLAGDPHFEMQIAADPFHAGRLMACSMLWPAGYSNSEVVTYASLDGGKSWKATLRTRGESNFPSWDPACTYGPDGIAYSVSENQDSDGKSFERIDRSNDGGKTWETPVRMKHAERDFITVDKSGGKQNGWIYLQGAGSTCTTGVHCLNGRAYYFQYSTDGGRTFLSQTVPTADGNYNIGFGEGVVLSDGTFLAPMGEWKNYSLPDGTTRVPVSVVDHDGRWGNTALKVFRARFNKPNWPLNTEVFPVGDWFLDRAWNRSMMAMMAVDASHGPFRDRVYLVWPDVGSGRSQILLSYSADEGKTWSHPRVIDDDRSWTRGGGPDDIHGQIAVNPQGVVGISWYDRRDHPDNLGWTVRFRASFDGGETFTPSVKVSEAAYDPEKTNPVPLMEMGHGIGRPPNTPTRLGVHSFHYSGGHTAGLAAAADGTFHPLWVGNSTSVPQLWSAAVTANGSVQKNGSAELATLKDVSGKVELRFTNRKLFRPEHMVETDIQLENLSDDAVHAPLKLRVLDLSSDLGAAEIANADAGGKGEGAIFDFTPLLDGNELKPHAITKPRRVKIKMVELDALRPLGHLAVFSLACFDTKVLAGSVTGPTKDSPTLKKKPGASPDDDDRDDER